MKLKAEFDKTASGKIVATLAVVDEGDFTTREIFSYTKDYPSLSNYRLEEKNYYWIKNTLPTPQEALEWAQEQIQALKKHLEDWRAIQLPEDFEVEI